MRRILAVAAAMPALLAACGADPAPLEPVRTEGGAQTRELTVGGQARTYRAFVPPTVPEEGSAPAVVVLHDAGGTVASIQQVTQFDRAATAGGFVAVYPEGTARLWNAGFCCGGASGDDLTFLQELVRTLPEDLPVDPDRRYVVGVSNGAVMAYHLACAGTPGLAGIAAVAGTMLLDGCEPSGPLDVLALHGTADQIVPFAGGEMPDFARATAPASSVLEVAGRWAELNGCATEPAVQTADPVTTTTWNGCADDVRVRLLAVEGAGHVWFAEEFGPVDGAIDATGRIVTFFALDA